MVQLESAAVLTIFLASIVGSPHCAGMCGGFVALYSHEAHQRPLAHLLYSFGRLTTYSALGVSAAWAGRSLDSMTGVSRFASLLVGAMLVAAGGLQLLGRNGMTSPSGTGHFGLLIQRLARPIFASRSPLKPFAIGLVTTFLPCGWLYSFVSLAMASSDSKAALVIMSVFWLGTLPIMVSFGVLSEFFTRRLGSWAPRLTGLLLVITGLLSLAIHWKHANHTSHQQHHEHHVHH